MYLCKYTKFRSTLDKYPIKYYYRPISVLEQVHRRCICVSRKPVLPSEKSQTGAPAGVASRPGHPGGDPRRMVSRLRDGALPPRERTVWALQKKGAAEFYENGKSLFDLYPCV